MRNKKMFHFLFVAMMTCSVMGQVKKQLTEQEYKLWSTLEPKQLSKKGSWVSFALHYENSTDTLFVKNTTTSKTFAFAGATDGQFANDYTFVARGTNADLILTNLNNEKERRYNNISSYALALDGQLLIMLKSDGTSAGELNIVGIDGTLKITLPKVSLYTLNAEKNRLVCNSERKIQVVNLKKPAAREQLDSNERAYSSFAWQNNGLSFAWIADDNYGTLGYYQLKERKCYTFDRNKYSNFSKDTKIYNASITELSVSDDGTKVFFGITEKQMTKDTTGVQLWNTADKILYPNKAYIKDWTTIPKLAVWFPERQKCQMVTNTQFPRQMLMPQQQYALVYNPIAHEPQFDSSAPIDYYLKNIATGQQHVLLTNQSATPDRMGISNTGKFVAYFKEKQWWVYNITSDTRQSLTGHTVQSFTDAKYDRSGEEKVNGIAGWTTNDTELVVYDQFDIWLLKTDGSSALRLTKGREKGIVYRLVSKSLYSTTGSVDNGVLNLNQDLLLEAISSNKSGYFTWSSKSGLKQIVFENNRMGWLKQAENGAYVYSKEHYHLPPQLVYQLRDTKPKVLYQSNAHHNNYNWGFSKLIAYQNAKGQLLNGALFYPAGYDAHKTYPMIVHIYERLSDYYNQYVNPSVRNSEGFNISNLTTQGYFVLLPDIAYEESVPGRSALDCVTAAVDEVLANESVDPTQLGILGHSFGGYETNFIVTQTNKFAAAISGAGIADIISNYLTIGRTYNTPNGWRYEFNQSRMGVSLFEGYDEYVKNSPITFAKNVETPILLWTGDADKSVEYSQSLEFHLALRRLQKPNIMLLYEGEGHSIMKLEHQIDLTHRMQDWWDYYLKGGLKPNWLNPDKI